MRIPRYVFPVFPFKAVACLTLLTASCVHRTVVAPGPSIGRGELAESSSPEDMPEDRNERVEYFKARRLVAQRLTEVRNLLGTASPAASSATANPQQWTFIGPQPMVIGTNAWAGSVRSLMMDPHDSNTIYAVTFLRKLWKTTDAGTTWLPLSDAGPLLTIQWLAADPVATNTLYAMDGGSLYKSPDGGSTWTALAQVTSDPNCAGEAFAVHPDVSGTWLVSEYCSGSSDTSVLYRTTNSGVSWTKVATIHGEIDEVEFNAGTPAFAYASGSLANAVLFEASTDSGATWTTAVGSGATALPQAAQYSFGMVRFAAAPTSPKTIYLRTETYTGDVLALLYKSTDGGSTWNLTGLSPEGQGPRTPALTAVDPTNANIVYAGSLNVLRSTDGGATFTQIQGDSATGLHSDNHAMIFTPDGTTAYESNDGGVWKSTNFRTATPATWINLNNTFGTAEFEPVFAMDPTNINRSFGGLQDNNTMQYSGALAWNTVGLGGDGNGNAINPQNPNIVYSVNDSAVHKSTAGGAPGTWTQLIPQSGGGRLFMDFTTPNTLYYFLGNTLQQTQDGGNTWPVIATLPVGISKMAVAPSTSNTVVVIGNGTPFVTNDAPAGTNATFSARLPVTEAANVGGANGIVIDPTNPAKFYSLENSSSAGSLLVSADGGMSWQAKNLGPNVPDSPTDLLIDPDLPNTMYLGTESSVFRTSDGGATWWPLASGFPMVKVTSVNLHRGARVLRVATAGRGAWDLAVPTTAPSLSSASVSGSVLTVNGTNLAQGSAIWLNGTALTTLFVNSHQLTAAVPAGAIVASTVYYVSVNTPGSGGGLSDPIVVSTGPTIYPNGLENAAGPVSVTSDSAANSFAVGLAPGTFTALYGSQLASATSVATAPFPVSLGGVKVLVNGTPAPIYFASPSQIDFVMPWEAAGAKANIQVVTSAGPSNTVAAAIQTAPQIFTTNQQGSGQGAVLVAGTSTIVAPAGAFPGSRPAAKGEYISIYTTGLGSVQNQPGDGAIATGLSPTTTQPVVRIGCPAANGGVAFCSAPAQFAGLAPGFVGLYQVNVQIPSDALSGGQVPLQLSYTGGAGRPSNIVTIAIQ
jgi:uncharacterized protein (TIGR03437 family)